MAAMVLSPALPAWNPFRPLSRSLGHVPAGASKPRPLPLVRTHWQPLDASHRALGLKAVWAAAGKTTSSLFSPLPMARRADSAVPELLNPTDSHTGTANRHRCRTLPTPRPGLHRWAVRHGLRRLLVF